MQAATTLSYLKSRGTGYRPITCFQRLPGQRNCTLLRIHDERLLRNIKNALQLVYDKQEKKKES